MIFPFQSNPIVPMNPGGSRSVMIMWFVRGRWSVHAESITGDLAGTGLSLSAAMTSPDLTYKSRQA